MALQADGKILLVVQGDSTDAVLLRLNRDGSIDTTFGAGGFASFSAGDAVDARAVAVQPNGKIVVAGGYAPSGPAFIGFVARFQANGLLDGTFDGNGYREFPALTAFEDVAVDGQGRIVAAADAADGASAVVVRLLGNGAVDTAFNASGSKTLTVPDGGFRIDRLALQENGRIMAAGVVEIGSANDFVAVVSLLANGVYDNAFDGDGRAVVPTAGDVDRVEGLAALPNGGVVVSAVADATSQGISLAALLPNGTLDARFNLTGVRRYPGEGPVSGAALAVTAQGHYVAVGRIDFAGSPDSHSTYLVFEGVTPDRDDFAGWTAGGQWYLASNTGSGFGNAAYGAWNPAAGWKDLSTADVTGDGLADAVGRDATGQWWIGVNTGTAFAAVLGPKWNEAAQWRDVRLADFNGDGKADVAGRTSGGQWWVSLADGSTWTAGRLWDAWNETANWRHVLAADFDGDGRDDLTGRTASGQVWVALSVGTQFLSGLWAQWNPDAGWRDVLVGDFTRDGRADLIGRTSGGHWYLASSLGTTFVANYWTTWNEAAGWRDVVIGDFDRNGYADIAGRTSTGQWFVTRNTFGTPSTSSWGSWNEAAGWRDVRVGDFNGDGYSDLAGRTSGGQWYVAFGRASEFATLLYGAWNEAAGWRAYKGELAPTLV